MKKIGEIKHKVLKNKKELYIYLIILSVCLVICSPLLQMHIASDTYNLMDLGYFEYPNKFFLKDARIVSTLLVYIAGLLNVSYETFIVLGTFFAIIITSISIYTLYKMIIEKIDIKNNEKLKILILLGIFIIIFNALTLEYLLYAECSIMCLSVLLSIIAVKTLLSNKKNSYIKSLILVIIAVFSYQGSVNIYVTLTVLMLFIDKAKSKKEIIKIFAKTLTIFVIAFVLNIIAIYVLNNFLSYEQNRIVQNGILNNIKNSTEILQRVLVDSLIINYNLWPIAIIPITILIAILILAYQKNDKMIQIENLIKYVILIVIAIGVCVGPIFLMERPALEPRMCMSIGSIIGISIIYLIINTQSSIYLRKIIEITVIIFFIYNSMNCINIFNIHIVTNKIDQNQALSIKSKIEKYEEETKNTITQVAYCKDKSSRGYHYGYKMKYSSFSQRAFDNYYCIIEALNYYCNRKLEKVPMNQEIYLKYFANKDWDTYMEEQIVFKDNTMYICTY